ncbi:MAG: ATPase, partial [Chloroflexota bacterium]|nr:ATPase [Chloroflexota bacterium]
MSSKNKTTITAESDKQELFIIREFDAPRELVFRAYIEPEIYAEWLG